MCGRVTATRRAGLPQPISRRDTSSSLQHRPTMRRNNWALASPDCSRSLSNFYFPPSVSPSCQNIDGRMCIVVSVATWCQHELSCADSLESICTLIWVVLLGPTDSNSSDYGCIHRREGKSMGICLDLAVYCGKYWNILELACKHIYCQIALWHFFSTKEGGKLYSAINSKITIHFKMRWLMCHSG